MGFTVQPDGPAKVELAKVVGVNFREYTVDLQTVFTNRPLIGVPFATPYTHGDHGGGVNFMPEVGSHCYVCLPADETSFILGFVQNPRNIPKEIRDEDNNIVSVASDGGPDFSGLRHPLEPGDIMLSATGDNFVILRRGGVLQIGSTALAQRVYIPIENTVRDFFQRYQAYSPLGEIEWGHATLTDDDDMSSARNTPVVVKYSIKAKAQEDVTEGKFTVEVRMGDLTNQTLDTSKDSEHLFANGNIRQEEPPTSYATVLAGSQFTGIPLDGSGVLSITIYSHDDSQKKVTYAFQVDPDGNTFIRSEASVHIEVANTVYAKVSEGVKIDFGDLGTSLVALTKSDEFVAEVRRVVLNVIQDMTIKVAGADVLTLTAAGLGISVPILGAVSFGVGGPTVGGEGSSVVVDKNLLSLLKNHIHTMTPEGVIQPSVDLVGIEESTAALKIS